MRDIGTWRLFYCIIGLLLLFQATFAFAAESYRFPVGSQLPLPTLGATDSPDEQRYLGLKSGEPFGISQIASRLVLIEFIGTF